MDKITRILPCPRCKGEGRITEEFYPSPCCGADILSSFGESYCSKCKRDNYQMYEYRGGGKI